MVECEFVSNIIQIRTILVLIDTWWNVNDGISIFNLFIQTRFNRYMVECEY